MSQPEVAWDLDSDEIASIASEELHENRPNRWKGSKSTWRDITEEERLLWRFMKQLQDEDLGVHLYNAFALKKRAADPETAKEFLVQTEDGQETIWTPPKWWTAWPLRQKHLPPVGLFNNDGDGQDEFVFRRNEDVAPSSELRSEVTATILRIAKERFSRRNPPQPIVPSIETPASPRLGEDSDGSSSTESELESQPSVQQAIDVSIAEDEPHPQRKNKADKTYDGVVSADDQLSATLLKPSVQHILTLVDKTLTALHNMRAAGLTYLSDSSVAETPDGSDTERDTKPRKRGRGRPRLPPRRNAAAAPSGSKRRRGRPKKVPTDSKRRRGRPKKVHVPEPGETLEEMELRVARLNHRRLPTTEVDREAAFEDWLRGDKQFAREQRQPSSRRLSEQRQPSSRRLSEELRDSADRTAGEGDDDGEKKTNAERRIRRWGLRDWSEVVAAATLAGFPPRVIQRTAQRCANLFEQGMTFTHLDEVPAARAAASICTTTYRPEPIRLSASPSGDSDSDNDSDNDRKRAANLKQHRLRQRSREGTLPSEEDDSSRSRSRSRSRSGGVLFFCPQAWCNRAASGFSRRDNLRRHMRLKHPECDKDPATTAPQAAGDSEDETLGAVHVDGFLRTINPGRGWRGDSAVRGRKRGVSPGPGTPPPAGRRPGKKEKAPLNECE
ncbi:RNA polymerase I specific transcription initiation factor [Cordyceps militaris CM01]|uniref:RNA polymerase I specific transcription initiation factor n=1 Tax=Cordyceps militaris (strain CM01) TaxID=983644 RepID=G3J6S1_CORMM|nr:RNA polymerase I specific transcription initiation factor [Cordyceps militaris CM01]EGX95399.1 RNA polymerase I specific transcription initiation factor [Cordyceps militaris CM01]